MSDLKKRLEDAGKLVAKAKANIQSANSVEEATVFMLDVVSAQLNVLIIMGGAMVGVERLEDKS